MAPLAASYFLATMTSIGSPLERSLITALSPVTAPSKNRCNSSASLRWPEALVTDIAPELFVPPAPEEMSPTIGILLQALITNGSNNTDRTNRNLPCVMVKF
jgi:hypothetical protein